MTHSLSFELFLLSKESELFIKIRNEFSVSLITKITFYKTFELSESMFVIFLHGIMFSK